MMNDDHERCNSAQILYRPHFFSSNGRHKIPKGRAAPDEHLTAAITCTHSGSNAPERRHARVRKLGTPQAPCLADFGYIANAYRFSSVPAFNSNASTGIS